MQTQQLSSRLVRAAIALPTAAALTIAATACAGHTHSSATTTTRRPSGTSVVSTTRPADPTSAVLAAYQQFWRVWLEANDPPNPNDPNLEKVAADGELETIRSAIADKVIHGTLTTLPNGSRYHHQAIVTALVGPQATVRDCHIDDSQIVRAADKQVVNGDVVTELLTSHLERSQSQWRVVSVREEREWKGVRRCV
jgi:hypothetical protein